MPLKIVQFGGIAPKYEPEALPENMAQTALNCSVSGGLLVPWSAPTEVFSLRESGSVMAADLSPEEYTAIDKPAPPSLSGTYPMCVPSTSWIGVNAFFWLTRSIDSGAFEGNETVIASRAYRMNYGGFSYTETGLQLYYTIPSFSISLGSGYSYTLYGPVYQFGLVACQDGPASDVVLPQYPTHGHPAIPSDQVPLFWNDHVYGYWQVTDVQGPVVPSRLTGPESGTQSVTITGGGVMFNVELNYTSPWDRRRHFYYCACRKVGEMDGPPSEISSLVTVPPGHRFRITLPGDGAFDLYRSTTGGDDFRKAKEDVYGSVYDDEREPTGDILPPYGNAPSGLQQVMLHPAHFGVGFLGKTLYLSDKYRLWAWPEENTITLTDSINCLVLAGNTVLAFAGNKVYGISGSNPESVSSTLLSDTAPLLDRRSLARMNGVVYWVTTDGLAACNGGGVQIISGKYFDRDTWQALSLSEQQMEVADGALLIGKLRFDIEEDLAAVTEYDGGAMAWKSAPVWFDQPTALDYVRVVCDGTATLTLYADGVAVSSIAITGGDIVPSGTAVFANKWELYITGTATVRRLEAYERLVLSVEPGEVRLTSEQVPVWSNAWIKFADQEQIAAGTLSHQGTGDAELNLYVPGTPGASVFHTKSSITVGGITWSRVSVSITSGTTAETATKYSTTVKNGQVFALPRSMPHADRYRVEVISDGHIDELRLFTRQTKVVEKDMTEIRSTGVPPWLYTRYQFLGQSKPKSLLAHGSGAVSMRLYADDAVDATDTLSVTPGVETLVDVPIRGAIEFDCNGYDRNLRSIVLFAQQATQIGQDGVSISEPSSWLGNEFCFADRGTFACYSLAAESYADTTMRLYRDGSLVYTHKVTDGYAHELPRSLGEGKLWRIDIESTDPLHTFWMMPRTRVALDEDLHLFAQDPAPARFMWERYEFQGDKEPCSVKVYSDSYPVTLDVYKDGRTTPSNSYTILDFKEYKFDIGRASAVELSFGEDGHHIDELYLFCRKTQSVQDIAVVSSPPQWFGHRLSLDHQGAFGAVAAIADQYPVQITLNDNAFTASDGKVFALPRTLSESKFWSLDAYADLDIQAIMLYQKRAVPVDGAIRVVRQAGPSWLWERYEITGAAIPRSVLVQADTYPVTMYLYRDGAATPSDTLVINGFSEVRIPAISRCGRLEFDFSDNNAIQEAIVFLEQVQTVQGAWIRENAQNWRGILTRFTERSRYSCGSIDSAVYPVTMTLYRNGKQFATKTVEDRTFFRLPRGAEGEEFEIDIYGTGIRSASLFESVDIAYQGDLRMVGEELPPWYRARYVYQDGVEFTSGRVLCDSYPVTMKIFRDGDTTAYTTVVVQDALEFSIPKFVRCNTVEVRFEDRHGNQMDQSVRGVVLYSKVENPIDQNGIIVRPVQPGTAWRKRFFVFPIQGSMSHIRVFASTYRNMYAALYVDGVRKARVRVTSEEPVLFPTTMPNAREWELDIECDGVIHEVHLFPVVEHAIEGGLARIVREQEPYTWLDRRIRASAPMCFKGGRILAGKYPITMMLYREDTLVDTRQISDSKLFRLPAMRHSRQWSYSLYPSDAATVIEEVSLGTSLGVVRQ